MVCGFFAEEEETKEKKKTLASLFFFNQKFCFILRSIKIKKNCFSSLFFGLSLCSFFSFLFSFSFGKTQETHTLVWKSLHFLGIHH